MIGSTLWAALAGIIVVGLASSGDAFYDLENFLIWLVLVVLFIIPCALLIKTIKKSVKGKKK